MKNIVISNAVRKIVRESLGVAVPRRQISFGFDFIDIAVGDPTRLSGMALNLKLTRKPDSFTRQRKGTFVKPGKFLRAVFPDASNDGLSRMAAKLQRHMSGKDDSQYKKLKVSDTPSRVYNTTHLEKGSLGCSCMRHMGNSMFEIFDDSPTTKILYLEEDNKLLARALLHEKVEVKGGDRIIKMMDRIYTTSDNQEQLFFRWAAEHGYHRKNRQSYDDHTGTVSPTDTYEELELSIPVARSYYSRVPYMDTFKHFCQHKKTLYNYCHNCVDDTLDDTEGDSSDGVITENGDSYMCNCCEYRYESDDMTNVNGEMVCDRCLDSHYSYCDHCSSWVGADYTSYVELQEDGYSKTICDSCLDNYSMCDGCETFVEYTEEVKDSPKGYIRQMCDCCIEEEDYVECDHCSYLHPSGLEECPEVVRKRKAHRLLNRTKAVVLGKARNSGVLIKNEVATFFDRDSDTYYTLELSNSDSYLNLVSHHRYITWRGTETFTATREWAAYDYITAKKLIARVTRMLSKEQEYQYQEVA